MCVLKVVMFNSYVAVYQWCLDPNLSSLHDQNMFLLAFPRWSERNLLRFITASSQVSQQDQGHAKGQGTSTAALRQGLHPLQFPLHQIHLGLHALGENPSKVWEKIGGRVTKGCLVDDCRRYTWLYYPIYIYIYYVWYGHPSHTVGPYNGFINPSHKSIMNGLMPIPHMGMLH